MSDNMLTVRPVLDITRADPIPKRLLKEGSMHDVMLQVIDILHGKIQHSYSEAKSFYDGLDSWSERCAMHCIWIFVVAWVNNRQYELDHDTVQIAIGALTDIARYDSVHGRWWQNLRQIFMQGYKDPSKASKWSRDYGDEPQPSDERGDQ